MKRPVLEVKTWLNSGNVVFSCEEADAAALADRIERMMQCEFGLDIPVFVILQEELVDILRHAPDWWGTENQEIYDNLVFLLPACNFPGSISRDWRAERGIGTNTGISVRCVLVIQPKGVSENQLVAEDGRADIGSKLTIRTANTVRKIVCM